MANRTTLISEYRYEPIDAGDYLPRRYAHRGNSPASYCYVYADQLNLFDYHLSANELR